MIKRRNKNMKLFAFKPQGHGDKSFFIMTTDIDTAKQKVMEYCKQHKNECGYMNYTYDTDYYEITVVGENIVIENNND